MNRIASRPPRSWRSWAALLLLAALPACPRSVDRSSPAPTPSGEPATGLASSPAASPSSASGSSRSQQRVQVGPLVMTGEGDRARATIEVVVANTGANRVRGVVLTGEAGDGATVSRAACTTDGSTFTCDLGTFEPGQSLPLTIAPAAHRGGALRTSLRLRADPADVGTGEARLDIQLAAG